MMTLPFKITIERTEGDNDPIVTLIFSNGVEYPITNATANMTIATVIADAIRFDTEEMRELTKHLKELTLP